MKLTHIFLLIVLMNYAVCSFASSVQYCPLLTGIWNGYYKDPTGLFPKQPFPIRLLLIYQHGHVIGYSLPSNDQHGGRYGSSHYIFTAACQHSTLSNVTVIQPHHCGGSTQTSATLSSANTLVFNMHWENAMTSTTFAVTLQRSPKLMSQIDQQKLHEARYTIYHPPQTCH